MKNRGKNIKNVRDDNRSLILKLICTGQCASRIALSRRTGLSKMTVSNIVADLIRSRWLIDGELLSNDSVGRNPVILLPDSNSRRVIGVYISRDKVTVSSITLQAQIFSSHGFPLGAGTTAISLMDGIVQAVEAVFEAEGRDVFAGIGVASIGPLDIDNGVLLSPPDFYGIEDVAIRQILEDRTGLPVILDNDMNAAALAELLYGKGCGCNNFIYLGITNGIGSGIILNGNLFSGAKGFGGEIGHVSIDYDGAVCSCGNKGCLEVYASMPSLLRRISDASAAEEGSALHGRQDICFRDAVLAADANDRAASGILDDFCSKVSTALLGAIHMLNPEKIFIGHESAQGGDGFARKLERELNTRSLFRDHSPVSVQISAFGEVSPVIGSGVLYLESLFSGRIG
ncbi:MAG: ROK family protein [Saccharofermentanales bacterium]